MVSSRYGTDSFVSVWYHYDTDSGDFQKNFDSYLTLVEYSGSGLTFHYSRLSSNWVRVPNHWAVVPYHNSNQGPML